MKSTAALGLLTAIAAQRVAGHATFQDLWVDGVDMIMNADSCVRLPLSNSPVTDVSSTDLRCNRNSGPVSGKCSVAAGGTVTVEMHQQPGDRDCSKEAIGGNHYGPVMVYMSAVADSSTADGSGGWFKVYEDAWAPAPGSSNGDGDYWGTKDMNAHCGRMDVPIPADLAAGDYLLRAEVIALHTAMSPGGAQLYMSCYQITVEGGGSLSPPTVSFPGAYSSSDPGILINIHAAIDEYIAPGPEVIPEGTVVEAGTGGSSVG